MALGATDSLDFAARARWPLDEAGMKIGEMRVMKVSVIGGGAWGTALAEVAARAGHEVSLIVLTRGDGWPKRSMPAMSIP